jgi:hypothetical protein
VGAAAAAVAAAVAVAAAAAESGYAECGCAPVEAERGIDRTRHGNSSALWLRNSSWCTTACSLNIQQQSTGCIRRH